VPHIFREYRYIKDIYGIRFYGCLQRMVKYIVGILLPYPCVVLTVYYYSILVCCWQYIITVFLCAVDSILLQYPCVLLTVYYYSILVCC